MEDGIYLCIFFVVFSGVTSQSVTITEDTVYIMNNVEGQVTCTLNGNCAGIFWYLSSITAAVASAYVGYPCLNTTNGYYQTCNNQNHQYTLFFTGTTNLHGQTLRCSGEGCTPQQTVSDTATIFIIVPVPSVALEGINGQQITVTAGQSKSITCVTGSSRPAPRILWYIGMTNMTSLSTEAQIPSQEPDLFYTRSTLTFIPTKSQNGLQLNCKAYNTDNNIAELTTKPTLNVQYGPDPVTLTPSTNYYIVNETFQLGPIKCSAICKPVCSYKWIRPNQNVIQGDTVTIHRIQRTQTGTYKCQAYNTVGTRNSSDISVTVHFAAKVTSINISGAQNFTIPEHSTKSVICLAEGLPQPTITLKYISNSSIIKSVIGQRLEFTFPSARCEDTGIYKCEAINKFTPQQPLQKEVFVMCKPRAASHPLKNHFVLNSRNILNITLSYIAYPRPIFQWFKNISDGSSTQITDYQDNVQINTTAVNTYTYVTQLIRRNLKEDDFGTYVLRSSNVIGTNEDIYTIKVKGKPDQPIGGLAICIDYNSAVITWVSGFDNGDKQTFTVVFQEKGETEQSSISNIKDPGLHKPISRTVVSLKESKLYVFRIFSRNVFGESSRLTVNCSTKAQYITKTNTGEAVGAGIGSALVLVIILVIVIYSFRRYQAKAKGTNNTTDSQRDGRNQTENGGDSNETHMSNILNGKDTYGNASNTGTQKQNYETMHTLNDEQPYEQIKMEDISETSDADAIYVNTTIR